MRETLTLTLTLTLCADSSTDNKTTRNGQIIFFKCVTCHMSPSLTKVCRVNPGYTGSANDNTVVTTAL